MEIDLGNIKRFAIIENNNFLFFGEIEKNTDWLDLNLWTFSKAERNKKFKTHDIPSAFFHFLVLDNNCSLLSDKTMSKQGTNFWKRADQRAQLLLEIFDNKLGKIYGMGENYNCSEHLRTDMRKIHCFDRQ